MVEKSQSDTDLQIQITEVLSSKNPEGNTDYDLESL